MMIYFFKKFNANYSDKDEVKKYTYYNSDQIEDFKTWLKDKLEEDEIIVEIDN